MADLIDRQAAIDVICTEGCGMCAEALKDIPTAVVRCKECRYLSRGEITFCRSWNRIMPGDHDGFCSFGERITDER